MGLVNPAALDETSSRLTEVMIALSEVGKKVKQEDFTYPHCIFTMELIILIPLQFATMNLELKMGPW